MVVSKPLMRRLMSFTRLKKTLICTLKKKSLTQHADDLKTLLSAAMTNQETCLDGFSHDKADKKVREVLLKGRKLTVEEDTDGWPKWLSAGDRRLLQSSSVTSNVVVAADGSGNYKMVSEAVAAAPEGSSQRYVIRIKAGVYRENVDVPRPT
ncbi:unnamed protein product [Ilex paraguariensis]|uniref:Pectinesterase n=1 Tax=Ilex paraguariensis TaxID=185542 RepID=A0ABC8RNR9_9AQUA